MASYYVVPFTAKEFSEHRRLEFTLRVNDTIHKSIRRLAKNPQRKDEVLRCVAFCYDPESSPPPRLEEYNQYQVVYFFNEACMRWFEEAGLRLNVVRTLPEDELPPNLVKAIQAPYLPE